MGEKIFVTVFPSFATLSNVTFLCDFTGETDTGLHSIRCKLKPNQNARFQPSIFFFKLLDITAVIFFLSSTIYLRRYSLGNIAPPSNLSET